MVCRHLSLAFLQNLFTKQCLGRQIDEEEYKKKCGGGIIPPGEKCTKIDGIKRVKTSCADKETRPGGRCKLECEESGVQLGVGHEMHGNLVCEKKDGGVSNFMSQYVYLKIF